MLKYYKFDGEFSEKDAIHKACTATEGTSLVRCGDHLILVDRGEKLAQPPTIIIVQRLPGLPHPRAILTQIVSQTVFDMYRGLIAAGVEITAGPKHFIASLPLLEHQEDSECIMELDLTNLIKAAYEAMWLRGMNTYEQTMQLDVAIPQLG